MLTKGRAVLIAAACVLALGLCAIRPARATDAGEQAKARAALKAAEKALAHEFQANPAALRTRCDYFDGNRAPEVTAEAIIAELDDLPSGNPREEAYIGWQLLSGLPYKVDAELAPRLCRAYRDAPDPIPHPGLSPQIIREGTAEVARLRGAEATEFNRRWKDLVEQRTKANDLIANYRDELFAKLPSNADTVTAGFEDAWERASAGVDADRIMAAAMSACRNWAYADASPADLNAVGRVVEKMHELVSGRAGGQFPPRYFNGARVDARTGAVSVDQAAAKFVGAKALEDLALSLHDCVVNPGGGLKFRPQDD